MLLLLLACHVETVSECVTEAVEIEDDEALDGVGFTVADLAAAVGGTRTFDAALADGTTTTATLDLARTDAPAVLLVRTTESHDEVKPGLYADYNLVYHACDDLLTVPFDLALSATSAGIDVGGAVVVTRDARGNERDVGVVDLRSEVEPAGFVDATFDGPDLVRLALDLAGDPALTFPAGDER